MIYILLPIVVTFIIVGELWQKYRSERTQDSFNVAASATFTSILASATTSACLWVIEHTTPVVHWLDTPWAWLLVPASIVLRVLWDLRGSYREMWRSLVKSKRAG